MTESSTGFVKDEEKDINLLLARIKKSPPIFRDRVVQKLHEFSQLFNDVKSSPGDKNTDFCRLSLFFGQVYEFYPTDLRPMLESLIQLFEQHSQVMHPLLRYKIIQTLIMIKKKGFMDFFKSFNFFMNTFSFPDKQLRALVFEHLANYLRSMSLRKNLLKNETRLLALFQETLATASVEIQRRVVKLLTKLYVTNVWSTVKSANLIANQIHSKDHKVSMMVASFLVGSTEVMPKDPEEEDERQQNFQEIKKQCSMKNKLSKKKLEKMERQMQNIQKKEERMSKLIANSNLFPIDMLYNSCNFVDTVYAKLMKDKNMKFTLKNELMCLMGRIIGRAKLIYPNYYHYVLRFVRPELKGAERLYAFVAESTHANSPMTEVEMVCKQFLDTFVCEGNSDEKIVVGINFLRHVIIRNELAMSTEQINQVARFRSVKNKLISSATKGFINVVRDLCPDSLDKEFHVYNFKGDLDVRVGRKSDVVSRVEGAELLKQDKGGVEVEAQRILTEEDFRKIRKLKARKIAQRMELEEEGPKNVSRAIHMPKEGVLEKAKRLQDLKQMMLKLSDEELSKVVADSEYQELIKELEEENEDDEDDDEDDVDEDDIDEDDVDEDVDEDDEDEDDDEDVDEDDIDDDAMKIEDDDAMKIEDGDDCPDAQPSDPNEPKQSQSGDSESEEDEESEIDNYDHDQLMRKRGFLTENMLNTKKSIKEQKRRNELNKLESAMHRKYNFKKLSKKGSKTNNDKSKCKPAVMLVDKMRQAKKLVKQSKKKISKDKNFKGRPTKYDRKQNKK